MMAPPRNAAGVACSTKKTQLATQHGHRPGAVGGARIASSIRESTDAVAPRAGAPQPQSLADRGGGKARWAAHSSGGIHISTIPGLLLNVDGNGRTTTSGPGRCLPMASAQAADTSLWTMTAGVDQM